MSGVLLLATILVPWGVYGKMLLWSWRIFDSVHSTQTLVLLEGAWLTGLIALIASIFLRDLWLSVTYLLAGAAGMTLYLIATQACPAPWIVFVPQVSGNPWLQGSAIISLALFLVITGIRVRGSSSRLVCILQFLAATSMLLYTGIAILEGIKTAREEVCGTDLGSVYDYRMDLVLGTVVSLLALCGTVLVCGNSLWMKSKGTRMTLVGRRMVFWGLAILFLWGVADPAVERLEFSEVFSSFNNEILLACVFLIVLEGAIGTVLSLENSSAARLPNERAWKPFLGRWGPWVLVPVQLGFLVFGLLTKTSSPLRSESSESPQQAPATDGRHDWPQWCGQSDRNMVSTETNLPDRFEGITPTKTSDLENVRWVVKLGNQTLGSPVIAGGRVYIGGALGTSGSNDAVSMLWCFRETDGVLLWRMRSPYIPPLYNRFSYGNTSTPTVEGDRLFLLSHLGDVLCMDAQGCANGNDGPFLDEAGYFASNRKIEKLEIAPDGSRELEYSPGTPAALSALDGDIVWKFDLLRDVNCWPFNALNAAILVRGDRLYVATTSTLSNFREGSKIRIDAWKKEWNKAEYDSPSLIVLDKKTGKLLARDHEGIFEQTFHGAHSSPAMGIVRGKELLFYGGGNGTCYAFDPDFTPGQDGKPGALNLVWKFNCLAPESYKKGFRVEQIQRAETLATPVFYKNRIYTSIGNDLVNTGLHAKPGRLLCLDATQTGDVTSTARIWSYDDMRSSASTVAIADGLLYAADASGMIYCLDAETGALYWTHKTEPIISSPLIADGKVYVGTHLHGLLVFAHSKEKKLISELLGNADIFSSPATANGVLYIATSGYLYAIESGKHGALAEHAP